MEKKEYEVDLRKQYRGKKPGEECSPTMAEIFKGQGIETKPADPPKHWNHMVVSLDDGQREALVKTGFVDVEPAVANHPRPTVK